MAPQTYPQAKCLILQAFWYLSTGYLGILVASLCITTHNPSNLSRDTLQRHRISQVQVVYPQANPLITQYIRDLLDLYTTLVTCHVTRYKRIPVLLGYTQVIHRILTGYTKVIHTPPPVTSCAQGPEGEGEVPLTRGGITLFDIAFTIWNIYYISYDVIERPQSCTGRPQFYPQPLGYHVEQVNLWPPTVTSCCIDSGTSQYGVTMLGLQK